MKYLVKRTFWGFLIIFLSLYSCKDRSSESPTIIDDLYHYSVGSGNPLIIVHGGPGLGSAYLENHLKALSEHHELIFYDQRNSGRSPLTMDSTLIRLDPFLDDIDQLRKYYGHEKISILGHSWGGLLAMNYALRFPKQTNKLILVNSVSANSELNDKANTLLGNKFSADDKQARAQIMRTEAFKNQNSKAYDELMMLGFAYQFSNRTLINQLALQLPDDFAIKSTQLGHLYKDLYQYNFTSELTHIQAPTLLIYGLDDPLTSFALNSISQAIPQNRIEGIKNAGHFPFIEKKKETLAIINGFLED